MTPPANVILVEGDDDLHSLLKLLACHGIERPLPEPPRDWGFVVRDESTSQLVSFKDKGGFDKMMREVHVELKASRLDRLALIVDADDAPQARWISVRDALRRAGIQMPDQCASGGTIHQTPGWPSVGVWLMPDNMSEGALEHFLAEMIVPEDGLWPYAIRCVEDAKRIDQRFKATYSRKAEVHTWLAWQEEPGSRLSQAVTRRYFRPDCNAAVSFLDWFRRWLKT
jgi:hypothetical protein